jgi:hypothetical protein
MASPLSVKPKRTESEFGLSFKKYDEIGATLRTLIKWGSLVLIVRYGYLSVASMAGRHTLADIAVRFLGNLKVSESIAYILGSGGLIYGAAQRQLRRRNIQRLVKGKNDLEKLMNPGRTSSDLKDDGTTRPGDKL